MMRTRKRRTIRGAHRRPRRLRASRRRWCQCRSLRSHSHRYINSQSPTMTRRRKKRRNRRRRTKRKARQISTVASIHIFRYICCYVLSVISVKMNSNLSIRTNDSVGGGAERAAAERKVPFLPEPGRADARESPQRRGQVRHLRRRPPLRRHQAGPVRLSRADSSKISDSRFAISKREARTAVQVGKLADERWTRHRSVTDVNCSLKVHLHLCSLLPRQNGNIICSIPVLLRWLTLSAAGLCSCFILCERSRVKRQRRPGILSLSRVYPSAPYYYHLHHA